MGLSLSRTKRFIPVDYRSKPGEAANAKSISLSKENLYFGCEEKQCPIGQTLHDELVIKNKTSKSIKFKFEPIVPKTCTMNFEPPLGTVKKDQSLTVRFNLVIQTPENFNFKVTLRVEGEEAHFIGVRLRCDLGVFGCDPSTLEQSMDNGYQVPLILVQMKQSLITHDAFSSEGIFRIAGETAEVKRIKQEMNKKQFKGDPDINSLASLMKIWFRELPSPLLNAIPPAIIMNSHEHQLCIDTFAKLPEPQKTLMNWLTDLLLDFAANSAINKMTAQNLAIVVAPNLYEPPGSDPMEGLVLSQKCVQFFYHIMMDKQAQREEAAKKRNESNNAATQSEAPESGNHDSNESINVTEIKSNHEQGHDKNPPSQCSAVTEKDSPPILVQDPIPTIISSEKVTPEQADPSPRRRSQENVVTKIPSNEQNGETTTPEFSSSNQSDTPLPQLNQNGEEDDDDDEESEL